MQILMITENDPAGMAIAFSNAINKYTDHNSRLVSTQERYGFDYETDLHLPHMTEADFQELEELLVRSDIFHFHMLSDETTQLGRFKVGDYIRGKALVHHHHGHPEFRSNPEFFRKKYKKFGRKSLVSTPDLLHLLPGAKWIPNIVPINHPLYLPIVRQEAGRIVVSQSPTRKDLKNTSAFLRVLGALQKKYDNLELNLIHFIPHAQCLRLKQQADINFDHMQGYFGVSSLESLSMGVSTIAGIDEWNIECIKKFTGADDLPWQICRDEPQLYKTLETLILDPALRDGLGAQSRKFMEEHWTEQDSLKLLIDMYKGL